MPGIIILFRLTDDTTIRIEFVIMQDGWGDLDDGILLCSPKEMGKVKNINDLVTLLEDNMLCDSEYGHGKIFKEDVSEFTSEEVKQSAMTFIEKVKKIKSMDDIKEIIVVLSYDGFDDGDEYIEHTATYTYDLAGNQYTCKIVGDDFDNYFNDYRQATRI